MPIRVEQLEDAVRDALKAAGSKQDVQRFTPKKGTTSLKLPAAPTEEPQVFCNGAQLDLVGKDPKIDEYAWNAAEITIFPTPREGYKYTVYYRVSTIGT